MPTKLLLLGTGNSGKSTFTKQILLLYTQDLSKEKLNGYRVAIRTNCIEGLSDLVQTRHNVALPHSNPEILETMSAIEKSWESSKTPVPEWTAILLSIWEDPLNKQACALKDQLLIEVNVG